MIALRAGYADGPDGRLVLVRDGERLLVESGSFDELLEQEACRDGPVDGKRHRLVALQRQALQHLVDVDRL